MAVREHTCRVVVCSPVDRSLTVAARFPIRPWQSARSGVSRHQPCMASRAALLSVCAPLSSIPLTCRLSLRHAVEGNQAAGSKPNGPQRPGSVLAASNCGPHRSSRRSHAGLLLGSQCRRSSIDIPSGIPQEAQNRRLSDFRISMALDGTWQQGRFLWGVDIKLRCERRAARFWR